MIGYQLGIATLLTMARYEEMIRSSHCWEISQRKPAPIILLKGEEPASLSHCKTEGKGRGPWKVTGE